MCKGSFTWPLVLTIMIMCPLIVAITGTITTHFGERIGANVPRNEFLSTQELERLKEYIDLHCATVYDDVNCERLRDER